MDEKARLNEFPNSFQLRMNDYKAVQKVIDTVETEQSNDPVDCHKLQNKNLLSYLYWKLGDKHTAEDLNDSVLKEDCKNVIALTNGGLMHVKQDDIVKARGALCALEKLKNTADYEMLEATAFSELAYSYSRFGPGSGEDGIRYDDKAISLYERILGKQPCNWIWLYRYGLVLQRSLSFNFYHSVHNFDANVVFKKACDALFAVATKCSDSDFVGKAWSKFALAIQHYNIIPGQYKGQCEEQISPPENLTQKYCIERAEIEAPDSHAVLRACGQFYRKKDSQDLHKARKCLEKALSIRENTTVYLHLGLLEVDEWNEARKSHKFQSYESRRQREGRSYDRGQGGKHVRNLNKFFSDEGTLESNQYQQEHHSVQDTCEAHACSTTLPTLPLTQNIGSYNQTSQHLTSKNLIQSSASLHSASCVFTDTASVSILDSGIISDITDSVRNLSTLPSQHNVTSNPVSALPSSCNDSSIPLLTRFLKSPNKLAKEINPDNPKLNKALDYFRKASELCKGTSVTAFNEMGMVNRRLNNITKARDCFYECSKVKNCPLVNKIKSFEQRGLCYLELAEKAEKLEDKNDFSEIARHMFFKAIEMQAIQHKYPVQVAAHSLPSLYDLLNTEIVNKPCDTKPRIEMSRLKRLIGDYREALKFLDDALSINPNDKDAQLQKAHTLRLNQEYEKAIVYLHLLSKTNVRDEVKPAMFLEAYLGAAENRLNNEDRDMAQEHFRMAYNIAFDLETDEDSNFAYEVSVIADESDEQVTSFFSEIIEEYFRLSCFIPQNILPGDVIVNAKAKAMKSSRNFLVLCNNNDHTFEYDVTQAISLSQQRPKDSYSWILIGDCDSIIPEYFQPMRSHLLPGYTSWPKEQNTSDFKELVMKLFKAIICRKMLKVEQV